MKIEVSISTYLENSRAGKALLKYEGKGLYIHFTKILKLGVNSKQFHRNFYGIYCYPVDWLIKNSRYDQFAITFPYYYIIKVDKSRPGIVFQHFSQDDLEKLLRRNKETTRFNKWMERNPYLKASGPASLLLDYYRHLKESKIDANLLHGIDWIEDQYGGIFNSQSPVRFA